MLGKAKVCLQDLLERQENKLHLDIPLTDNYVNPVEPQVPIHVNPKYLTTRGHRAAIMTYLVDLLTMFNFNNIL